jgi:hypothetical protein
VIPQTREDERRRSADNDELSLKGLLDGKTIPLLRNSIDITPSF